MRVLVTGAYGLIGAAVLARLHRGGHEVVGAGRSLEAAPRRFPYAHWVAADFTRLTSAAAWRPLLDGIDAVVNCVGVLEDSPRDDTRAVHVAGTVALFDACAAAGIRRVIHVSAIGAASSGQTAFARTKAEADAHLRGLDLDWVILRPALVLAPAAYGGSAMLRGIAAFPLIVPLSGADDRVQIVSIGDVADTVALCLRADAPTRASFDLAYPQAYSLAEIVLALRAWLGLPPRPIVALPRAVEAVVGTVAGGLGLLGWRSPARATALAQLRQGVVGDPAAWSAATGIKPASLADTLAALPAGIQERWFAKLYWLKPLAIFALAAFWIVTGVIALGPGRAAAAAQFAQAGFPPRLGEAALIAGALADIALGLLICVRRFTRLALRLTLALTAVYLLAATVTAPQLWLDPLGPLVKIIPVMVAILLTLAILDER
jgi:uncharacterized protein YbjT (DUF2867 family)